MTPRQLKYFLRISELKSFTKAAAVLHVAQPALSRQIQQLEADLGVQLFIRSDSGVTLTDAGKALSSRAVKLLDHLASVRDEISSYSDEIQGQLKFGIPPSFFDLLTSPLIQQYRAQFPAVELTIIEDISSTIHELILNGRLDIGIVLSIESMNGLSHRHLFDEQLFIAGANGLLDEEKSMPLEAISSRPLILTQRPNSMRVILEDILRARNISHHVVLETNSTRLQSEMAAAGLGFTVLSYSALSKEIESGKLTAAPLEDLKVTWTLVYSKDRELGNAAQQFIELLLELTVERSKTGKWPGLTIRNT
jgi:LysR family nitrogen assimilation transcriptional regulator